MATRQHYLLVLQLTTLFCFSHSLDSDGGFSVELIHRDSTKSPFYNPFDTPFQRLSKAFQRSMNRVNRFYPHSKALSNAPQADIISNQGEYLMRYSIGTPPIEILGIADTGSDLIWSQCKPCDDCYNQTNPIFDPSNSTTYKSIPCNTRVCESLVQSSCAKTTNEYSTCEYSMSYGDGSYSIGGLAFDTLTLGSTSGSQISFPNISIGCGHNNHGTFDSNGSGIVGLGGGSVSLPSQIGPSTGFKFSYCLIPFMYSNNTTSKINFGQTALVSGPRTVSTPIVQGPIETFYYLTLEGISVGRKRLDFVNGKSKVVEEGNIIIDSGTFLTFLPEDLYLELESEVASQMNLPRVRTEVLNLCYKAPGNKIEGPTITAHFGGADVELNTANTFVSVSDGVACLAFAAAESNGAIYGNLAQANYLVGYDMQNKVVSFKPTDCSKV
ncbi:aspartic proteinase CDR1 [Arachis stenosperma]|uniref:aspartic proteinase CDR1 n=1 Tax=Arachis stenosperma TaxID=217475 RepID=UPI0025AD341C|nr:aspartic proteinase CDR1 [Arachis stenosperma]